MDKNTHHIQLGGGSSAPGSEPKMFHVEHLEFDTAKLEMKIAQLDVSVRKLMEEARSGNDYAHNGFADLTNYLKSIDIGLGRLTDTKEAEVSVLEAGNTIARQQIECLHAGLEKILAKEPGFQPAPAVFVETLPIQQKRDPLLMVFCAFQLAALLGLIYILATGYTVG